VKQKRVQSAFEKFVVTLPISNIVPQREITDSTKKLDCYHQMISSLEHIGLIEPLVVHERQNGTYLLVDGHLRLDILKSKGMAEVKCILARDDEAYTYNKRVNYVPPIAQHLMLLEVLRNGVSEERVAAALNVEVRTIKAKRDLLTGICPEVIDILHDRNVGAQVFSVLRKMKPLRQIEAAEHMMASNTFSALFAKAILAVTKPEMLIEKESKKILQVQSAASHALLEQENDSLLRDLKAVEDSYGTDMLALTISCSYLEKILANAKIERYLERNHADTFKALRSLLAEARVSEAS
jgi:RepB plasmid partitioning protein/ParB-like nuclease domain